MRKRLQFVVQFPLLYLILWDLIKSFFVGRRTMELPTWVASQAVYKPYMKDKLAVKTGNGKVFASYTHCPQHQINLVIAYAAQTKATIIDAINCFGFVQEIYNFCNDSNRRWDLFLNIAKFEADSGNGNGDKTLAFTAFIEVTND